MASDALRYIHGEDGERRFSSQLMDEVMEGALGSHYVQYNADEESAEIHVVLLMDEDDRYSVVSFVEHASDPDDFDTTLFEESGARYDYLPDAISAFGEEAVMLSAQDNDESLAREGALNELARLRQSFGISPPPATF